MTRQYHSCHVVPLCSPYFIPDNVASNARTRAPRPANGPQMLTIDKARHGAAPAAATAARQPPSTRYRSSREALTQVFCILPNLRSGSDRLCRLRRGFLDNTFPLFSNQPNVVKKPRKELREEVPPRPLRSSHASLHGSQRGVLLHCTLHWFQQYGWQEKLYLSIYVCLSI